MKLIRGDSARWKFQRKAADGSVITVEPEAIFWTVKRSYDDQEFVIQKTKEDFELDEDYYYHFGVTPDDTNDLAYGTYYYDIEVIQDDGLYKQTIKTGEFIISPEATWASNEGEGDV